MRIEKEIPPVSLACRLVCHPVFRGGSVVTLNRIYIYMEKKVS